MKNSTELRSLEHRVEQLARRTNPQASETSVVTCPGARVAAWAVQVAGNIEYNKYAVRMLTIFGAGIEPLAAGEQMEAFNLAESFTAAGNLSAGSNVIMSRAGRHYVFYAPVLP